MYIKNRTIENKAKCKKPNNYCKKLLKNRKSFYSNLELNQNKLINYFGLLYKNPSSVMRGFTLLQLPFSAKNYVVVAGLATKEYEISATENTNYESKDGADLATKNVKIIHV